MTTTDIYRGLNAELPLLEPSGVPLKVRLLHLSVTSDDQRVLECSATFCVSGAQYSHIDQAELFGLDPSRRSPMRYAEKFDPAADVDIEAALAPEALAQLPPGATTANALAKRLSVLPVGHAALCTANWAAHAVTQEHDGRRNGYRVYRSGVNVMEVLGQAQTMIDDMEHVTSSLLDQSREDIPIFAELYSYFTDMDWDFALDDSIPALVMRYRGANGEWQCVAEAHDDLAQFLFYSECPVTIPAGMNRQLIEFLGRANAGLVIGNFEMDLGAGQVRFRTGVDVMGAQLNRALVHNTVRWNVNMMDHYLPGIMDVVAGKVDAADAIRAIEGQRA